MSPFAIRQQVPSEVGPKSQSLELTPAPFRKNSRTGGGGVEEPGRADSLSAHDETSSQRKAAGCFKRQVTLLKSLDRFSAPVPRLEPEVRLRNAVWLARSSESVLCLLYVFADLG